MTGHIIDATNMTLGRIASKAAIVLQGKDKVNWQPNTLQATRILIINASKMRLDSKKLRTKKYIRFSGYPGGLKARSQAEVRERKGSAYLIREAVRRMLPANKLRAKRLKFLNINQ